MKGPVVLEQQRSTKSWPQLDESLAKGEGGPGLRRLRSFQMLWMRTLCEDGEGVAGDMCPRQGCSQLQLRKRRALCFLVNMSQRARCASNESVQSPGRYCYGQRTSSRDSFGSNQVLGPCCQNLSVHACGAR